MNGCDDFKITVVVRSSGERTLQLCRKLLERQVDKRQIHVVSEVPFTGALKRTYEIGLERDLPWTLAVDADVLVRGDAIQAMLKIAELLDDNVFEIQGRILDKLSGGPRDGGLHLYRTALLEKGLKVIRYHGTQHRPEACTIGGMQARGFPSLQVPHVYGLHDYEQSYRDIYRKAFFYAHKWRHATRYWEPFWRKVANADADLEVALLGLEDGRKFSGVVVPDTRRFDAKTVAAVLHDHGASEKEELSPDAASPEEIGRFIDTFSPPAEYWAWISQSRNAQYIPIPNARVRKVVARTGWAKATPWLLGCSMVRLGTRLQRFAEGDGF